MCAEYRRTEGKYEIIIGFRPWVRPWVLPRIETQELVMAEPAGNDISADPDSDQENVGSDSQHEALVPTTDEVVRICPRFRILVIGKSGVGKSTLINRAFGVTEAIVSESTVGDANINTEIFSKDNERFVLHDSKGFEHGDIGNVKTVQKFIEERNNMPEIKDKLHAVWLCFGIQPAGGRMFETGVEAFLTLKNKGELGSMPVIAVFTKYDKLISRAMRTMDSSRRDGLSEQAISDLAKRDADAHLQEQYLTPFKRVGKEIPHVTISTKSGYDDTLNELIRLTFDNVREHVAKEASIVTAMAQKVNPGVKIDGSIEVGRSKYWRGLGASANFPGKTLLDCLDVIHTDIVNVWNFDDGAMHLHSKEFKALMANMLDDLVDVLNTPSAVGLSMAASIAGILTSVVATGPAAPIVIPIAASLVLAKWMYDVYKRTDDTLRRLMAYIVDLTLVMQNLFWLVMITPRPFSRRLIKLAYMAYNKSEAKSEVHNKISKFVKDASLMTRMRKDNALDEIIKLINDQRISSAEMFTLEARLRGLDISAVPGTEDESWDASAPDVAR